MARPTEGVPRGWALADGEVGLCRRGTRVCVGEERPAEGVLSGNTGPRGARALQGLGARRKGV